MLSGKVVLWLTTYHWLNEAIDQWSPMLCMDTHTHTYTLPLFLWACLIECVVDEDFLARRGLCASVKMECGGVRVTIKIELTAGRIIHTKCELLYERAVKATLSLSHSESHALHSLGIVHVQ